MVVDPVANLSRHHGRVEIMVELEERRGGGREGVWEGEEREGEEREGEREGRVERGEGGKVERWEGGKVEGKKKEGGSWREGGEEKVT